MDNVKGLLVRFIAVGQGVCVCVCTISMSLSMSRHTDWHLFFSVGIEHGDLKCHPGH